MNHAALRERLVDLAAGTLSPREVAEVEAHLAGCPGCRGEIEALQAARRLLADLPPVEAPEAGTGVLLAAARQAAEQFQQQPSRLLPRWLWAGALGLAGAAAAVTLSLRLGQHPPASPFQEDREALAGRVAAPAPATAPVLAPAPAEAPKGRVAEEAKVADAAPAPARRGEIPAREAEPEAVRDRVSRVGAAGVLASEVQAPALDQGEANRFAVAPPPPPAPAAAPARAAAKAAPPAARSWAPAGDAASQSASAAAGPASETIRTYQRCPGERVRRMTRDGAGRLVRRVREGTLDGLALVVEEAFEPDGALTSAVVRLGDRLVVVGAAEADAGRLQPLPGLRLARDAAEAEAAPPRCGP